MSWRICRILDFDKKCTSVHAQEHIAKMETGSQLAALANRLNEDIPKYQGVWNYDKYFPEFVPDLQAMLETVGRLLEDEEVWGAYDEWHRFMNRWDVVLPTPLWVQVGTVIVDGPGPTVTPIFHPAKSLARSLKPHKVMDAQWEIMRQFHLIFKQLAEDVRKIMIKNKMPVPPLDEILGTVKRIANAMDDDVKTPELLDHWLKLVYQDTLQHYGVPA